MTSGDRKLLFGVLLGFGFMLSAWTVLFVVASHNRMTDVPLAHKTAAPLTTPAR